MNDIKLKELKFINNYRKESIYELYSLFIKRPLDYNKVTRVKMIKEIFDVINTDPRVLYYFFNYKELKDLIDYLNGRITLDNRRIYSKLHLTYYDFDSREFIVPLYVKDAIKRLELDESVIEINNILDFTYGLLLTRGVVSKEELEELYNTLKPSNYSLSITNILSSRHKRSNLIKKTRNNKNKTYYYYLSEVDYKIYFYFDNHKPLYHYSFDDFINIGLNGYDIRIKIFNEVNNVLKEKVAFYFKKDFFKSLVATSQPFFKSNDDWFYYFLDKAYGSDSSRVLEELRMHTPNWALRGEVLTTCLCGSGLNENDCCKNNKKSTSNKAMLNEFEGLKFYDNWYFLLFLTNLKYGLRKDLNDNNFIDGITDHDASFLKELMFNNKEIINIAKNNYINKKDHYSINLIEGFYKTINSKFVAIKYINQKLLMVDIKTSKAYLVSGLSNPLSFNVPFYKLPKLIETRLIPLDDKIVYDTEMKEYDIKFTSTVKEILKQDEFKHIIKNIKDIK